MTWFDEYWLDITTTLLGLLYIWLEYRADILLWIVGIVMPVLDTVLYWQHGLYGDSALAFYYAMAAVYGLVMWRVKHRSIDGQDEMRPITCMPKSLFFPVMMYGLLAWVSTWFLLVRCTNSTVPVLDGFTNALSIVGMWALAQKYVEQWLFWMVVDIVCCYLYAVKGLPFKTCLYGVYVIIAVAGYFRWKRLAKEI